MAIAIPIALGVSLGIFEIGLAMALGALLSSPSDISGSFRHKKNGILLSALIAVLASLTGGYLAFDTWLLLPVLGITIFGISYLSVYGFRASLISFSGLFAIVLCFANISNVLEIYERAFFIGLGGLWYLLLAVIRQKINPKQQTEQFLSQSLELSGQYLENRAKLLDQKANREELQLSLLEIQGDLNEKHEMLRDILISSRKSSGNSNYERKRLLIFIQLVDVLELAMANPVNYKKMDLCFLKYQEQVEKIQQLIFAMANRLKLISAAILNQKSFSKNESLEASLNAVKKSLEFHKLETETQTQIDEGFLMLQNLFDYQEKQVQKIQKIERLLGDPDIGKLSFIKKAEAARFITTQEYDSKILLENFNFTSPIFKHSLRIALVVMIGYSIGVYFSLQNSYWILLTIIVIMRPNYGLTRSRSKQRTFGTLIGAAIAVGIVLITQNLVVYGILAIISLILAFAMVQKNFKTSATFITLSVVFIYALLKPNVLDVIQFRVVDTIIGAGLATLGNLLLWPFWEFFGIKSVISESIKANKEYLNEIARYYEKKGKVLTSYKLSRKQAFLATGNLNAAFQRMTQEPKSKQKNLDKVYELVVLNHTFLSSLASMGTYIQNHPTTKASAHFKTFVESINQNLERAIGLLDDQELEELSEDSKQLKAQKFFDQKHRDLTRISENFDASEKSNSKTADELQEVQLIIEQLKWLMDISNKLQKIIAETRFQ
ncbi:MAG: FUSC family protein [Flavobacteriaceae bacterium]|nr:FUSC family protein [Flavobacteriaceae bacterium]